MNGGHNVQLLAVEEPPISGELLEALISQAESITLNGFNLMEEHAAREFQKEEDLAALEQAVDTVFQKVQENVADSLTRWAEFCNSKVSPVAQADAKPAAVSRSACASDTAAFAARFNELRQELSYWGAALVAQEQKAAELSEEMKRLETELLAAKQLAELDTASKSPPLWRAAELSKAMARLGAIREPDKQLQETETPTITRHSGLYERH